MSDLRSANPAERSRIAQQVAEIVLATPGVLRIEPTVRAVLRGLSSTLRGVPVDAQRSGRAPDGVLVTASPRGVDIAVDVSTRADHPAVDVAMEVRTRLAGGLTTATVPWGRIDVTILNIGED